MQELLERDQYIHWHRLKDEDVVRDIFWCHPDAVKLVNACNLVFLIDNTYKTNRYKLPLLDFILETPTGMTFSTSFAYLEGERLNNVVWALECFRGIFLRCDVPLEVIVTGRYLALMNAVKTVFPECTNLLCNFHINKNVKAKCKSLISQRNAWEYVMDAWETLVDCPSEQYFDECLKKFEMVCSPWPMVEYAHWALKRVLQNSLGDLCSVWDAMNNMMTLQHTEIKASFETSTHVVGHVFKKTLYKRLIGMVSRYALNQIAAEFECVHYAGKNPSACGCVMRTTHGLPCACELSKYVVGCIPLDSIHMFWRRLSFSDQGLSEPEVSIKEEMETISKRFEELDVCGKFTLKTKLQEIIYPDQNSMCPPQAKVNTKGAPKKPMNKNPRSTKRDPSYWEYVYAFHSMQNSNSLVRCSASSSEQPNPRRIMPILLVVGPDHLFKELGKFSYEYMKLFGGKEKFEELRMPLLVDGLTKMNMDKYNVILVSLSQQQNMTFYPLRSQPSPNSLVHRIICIGHVYDNHFVQVYLKDHCPLPPVALLWSSNCHPQAKQWPTPYITLQKLHDVKKDYLTDKQNLDGIYYRQPFTDTGNHLRFQCMQLKNDDDVNTMLMCNHQFSCVGLIGLLCTIGRTSDGILNILEATMTPTHDALLYYNGRWNMPHQNEFVGYSFTGKNSKKFDIPSGCIMDEAKDLIKQVAPHGIPPYGIHETQTVRRLFFRQPSHYEYSDKIIKFEIIELKTNDDMMKVLVQSNYWKKFESIEILVVFSKHVMEMEDDLSLS
ncbi:PKS-NRPS hybrid synthetase [Glycine soja]